MLRKSIIYLLWLLVAMNARAQYPVSVQVQTMPPLSAQLSDLYAGSQPRIIVTLLNTDMQKPVLNVRLRFNIKGSMATLRNRDYGNYPVIQLDAGIPTRLSLNDLAPYFTAENLDIAGMSRGQFMQTGKLPDGYYTFCVEIVETKSGQQISHPQQGCSPPAWITTSEPPMLNLPRKAESISFRDPQNIIFNWTPRHMSSPNAAFQTEYEFTLVELWDKGISPEAGFSTMPPVFQTIVPTTTYLYGPAEPALLPGKQYAWRVKAKAKFGADEYDVFRNQGYSEIFWFSLQEDCNPPKQPAATVENGRITITWLPEPKMFEYLVEYREQGKDDAEWFSMKTRETRLTLYDVVPGRRYEYRVGGFCSLGNKTLGDLHGFAMPARDTARDKRCGILPDIKLTNQSPIQELQSGDMIMAGDFPVRLMQVTGNGNYTGYGYIMIPFLGDAKVKVKFNNIVVNTDRQLISGVIETTFDPFEKQVADIDKVGEQLAAIISTIGGLIDRLDQFLDRSEKEPPTVQEIEKVEDELGKQEEGIIKDVAKQLGEEGKDKATAAIEKLKQGLDCMKKTQANTVSGPHEEADCKTLIKQGKQELSEIQASMQNSAAEASTIPQEQATVDSLQNTAGNIYLAPNGKPFRLPADASLCVSCHKTHTYPNGALLAFKLGGKTYQAKIIDNYSGGGTFKGYYVVDEKAKAYTKECYEDKTEITGNKVEVILLELDLMGEKPKMNKKKAEYQVTDEIRKLKLCGDSKSVFYLEYSNQPVTLQSYDVNICVHGGSPVDSYLKDGKLNKWLGKKGMKATVYLTECETGKVTEVTAQGQKQVTLTPDQAREKVKSKTFDGDFAIFACYGKDGKWKVETNFNKDALHPTNKKLKDGLGAIEQEIRKQAEEEIKERNKVAENGGNNDGRTPEERIKVEGSEEEFYKESMGIVEAVCAVYDFGKEIVNEAKLPEGTWNSMEAKEEYDKSCFHMPGLLAGGADQVIDEVTEGIQFVQLCYTVVRKPKETVKGLWNGVKNLKWEDVRKLAFERVDNYKKGGVIAHHQGGKDGVRVAMVFVAGFKKIGQASKMIEEAGELGKYTKHLDELTEGTQRNMRESISEETQQEILKELAVGKTPHEIVENVMGEAADIVEKKGKKLSWPEVKALFDRGNKFNENARTSRWYKYDEVTVEGVKTVDGKKVTCKFRADSYDPDAVLNGKKGLIVSRKATDLGNIKFETFDNYLKELKAKYPPGAKITAPKYDDLKGQILQGTPVLEIPDFNKNFPDIDKYTKHARDNYGIEISFKPEIK